jgi:N-acetylmuramoyl-L-alanine amidase
MSHPGWDHMAGRGAAVRPPEPAYPPAAAGCAPVPVSSCAGPPCIPSVAYAGHDLTRELAIELFEQAGGESVRVIEALAAALVNRMRERAGPAPRPAMNHGSASRRPPLAARDDRARPRPTEASPSRELVQRFAICRRIARRGLGGTLSDPTGGATAFHRLGEHPAWADGLLPVAEVGPLLFYRP